MNLFLLGISNSLKQAYRTVMLLKDMDISQLITHFEQIEKKDLWA